MATAPNLEVIRKQTYQLHHKHGGTALQIGENIQKRGLQSRVVHSPAMVRAAKEKRSGKLLKTERLHGRGQNLIVNIASCAAKPVSCRTAHKRRTNY